MERGDERELIRRWQQERDCEALSALVIAHQDLVRGAASKYWRGMVPFDDLVGEGNVGLLIAINKFDLSMKTRLCTYAGHWVRACLYSAIAKANTRGRTGTPASRSATFWGMLKHEFRLNAQYRDRDRMMARMSESLSLSTEAIERGQRCLEGMVSLDRGVEDLDWYEVIATDEPTPEDLALEHDEARHRRRLVDRALASLDERERQIAVENLMGGRSLSSVGKDLSISRERARQLKDQALGKMRRALDLTPSYIAH